MYVRCLAVHHILIMHTQKLLPLSVVPCACLLPFLSRVIFSAFLFIHRPFIIIGVTYHSDKLVLWILLLLGTKIPMKSHEGPRILYALILSFHLM